MREEEKMGWAQLSWFDIVVMSTIFGSPLWLAIALVLWNWVL